MADTGERAESWPHAGVPLAACPPVPGPRVGERWLPAVSWLVVLCVDGYLLALPVRDFLIHFSINDGLSYPRIAFNVAGGYGSTYDQITRTNGYHPLWMWLHVPLMLGADSVMGRMGLVRVLWVGTTLASIAAWSGLLRRLSGSRLAEAVLVLVMGCFGWSVYVLDAGVETPLVLLLLGVSLLGVHRLTRQDRPTVRSCAWLGAAMAATFLARLDCVFVLVPLGALVLNRLRRVSAGHVGAWLVTAAGLPAPYLLWNVATFGGLLPVSGRVKTVEGVDLARTVRMIRGWMEHKGEVLPAGAYAMAAVAAVIGLVACVWVTRRVIRERPEVLRLLWVLPAGAVLHYAYYLVKMREINVPWHLYLQVQTVYLGIALLAATLCGRWGRVRDISGDGGNSRVPLAACPPVFVSEAIPVHTGRQAARGTPPHPNWDRSGSGRWAPAVIYTMIFVLVAGGTAGYAHVKAKRRSGVGLSFQLGDWIRRNLPAGSRVAAYDSFTFALGADDVSFVDLNGLVGDARLVELAKDKKQAEIIDTYGCEYVVAWITPDCVRTSDTPYVYLTEASTTYGNLRLAVVRAADYQKAWLRDDTARFPCP